MVIDTGIFIEHIRAKDKSSTTLYKISTNTQLFTSSISLYELYMGANSDEKKEDVKFITNGISVLPFTSDVSVKAAQIYHQLKRTNQLIEFRDIFIAATCLVNDLPIVTLNKKHFNRIEGLKVWQ